jgi:hypothetical protein
LLRNQISKNFILLFDVIYEELKHLYVQDLHWALYTDHCYPCLANYTHILEVFREKSVVAEFIDPDWGIKSTPA